MIWEVMFVGASVADKRKKIPTRQVSIKISLVMLLVESATVADG